jgi:hypothetical protein
MIAPARVTGLLTAFCVCSIGAFAHAQQQPPPAAPAPPDWTQVPTKTIHPRKPPEGWKQFSDREHGVTWFAPSEVKRTVQSDEPHTVVYDVRDGAIGISVFCIRTATQVDGSPAQFLDSMDESMLAAYRRRGVQGVARPIAHVKYAQAVGRILRIDVPGNKTTLKCDLTTPTQYYGVTVVGTPGAALDQAFIKTVTSLRFAPAAD